MGKALYRKYRSKKLSEIVGQEHVTTALSNALKNGRIGHAYLFTGPRGVGKTSVARIMAYEVNDLPYDENGSHLDIIEIDAASNRRIDEIRTLRERVHNAPSSAKFKVYIIDEVHMLTKEAFNALLKTLEEPPAHVIFILATTEIHKLPETIISRTQRFTFKPATPEDTTKHLETIAKQESIAISKDALQIIANQGKGSFRDSISLLDQIRNAADTIEAEHVQKLLGIAPESAIIALEEALVNKSADSIISQLMHLRDQGFQPSHIAKQLGEKLRADLLEGKSRLSSDVVLKLLERLLGVPSAHDPLMLLEIVLLEQIFTVESVESSSTPQSAEPTERTKTNTAQKSEPVAKKPIEAVAAPLESSPPEVKEEIGAAEEAAQPATPPEPSGLDENTWQRVLVALKQHHNTLYGIARMGVPLFETDKLTLTFKFAFHQKRFNDAKNKQILSDIITQETGQTFAIHCVLDSATSQPKVDSKNKDAAGSDPLKDISNIFGDAEVLE